MSQYKLKEAQKLLRVLGLTLKHNHWDREYIVKFKGESDDHAYFTNDLDDAIGTGCMMVRERAAKAEAKLVR